MKLKALLVVMALLFASSLFAQQKTDQIPATGGNIRVIAIGHASLVLQHGNKTIAVDPTGQGGYGNVPHADVILVTHAHGDHLDQATINTLKKSDTKIVAPPAVAEKLGQGPDVVVLKNGEKRNVAGVPIEAVPAYNIERGPKPGAKYHEKGAGNGYIVTLGGKRVYIAGDTECTPEMKALKNIEAAFLPMNLPYTMTPEEAAACVKAFRPKIVYPYHYRGKPATDLTKFTEPLKGEKGIEVRLLEWYPK